MCRAFCLFLILFLLSSCGSIKNLKKESARFQQEFDSINVRLESEDQLSQSPYGNLQLRLKGNDFELGYKKGLITKPFLQHQEDVFFQKVAEFVPKPRRQRLLMKFLKWYHRDILQDIPLNYRKEIYGLSRHAGNKYDYVGSKYERSLLLHGAHDIGHAMQDLMLVGCSSVALWGSKTEDGKLLIGRNFDFYVNDAFAENKIIEFIAPDEGYKYAAVSWPGMIGVVSGMNEKGLTITLNAGKSSIPLRGKTPISIVARDILQHAQNIDEAIQIAKGFEVFISESLLIGSAEDNRAVNIEISPKQFDVFEVNNDILFCTNHFQSPSYTKDKRNKAHISSSHSQYRLDKLEQSFPKKGTYQPGDIAKVLRDATGLNNEDIGYGNEKALNQLLAHHAVIFKPDELLMWVSNNPYQLGTFEAYDLRKVFQNEKPIEAIKELEITADPFLKTKAFVDFQQFKGLLPIIERATKAKQEISDSDLLLLEKSNPNLWFTHQVLGDYYFKHQNWEKASHYYEIALSKEVSSEKAKEYLQKQLLKARKKL
ncbi:C45 family autoproteolytic acyltransferase/hydolase [Sphingobacterium sp. UBA6645]|uniref:C45 family autoproteolytic acyltransferase/hydolase n=1 Tax=Sphingobacterium sp. UBA6645 TaxID=1947511 RepID=UPI0025D024E9|nr:C45 family autoproteolytic acyltransferase/hydolase [Sphingobacterium sp. UBA6645]